APMTAIAEAAPKVGAGGCDWLALWRQMYDAERAQVEAIAVPGQGQAGGHWAKQAPRFSRAHRRAPPPGHLLRLVVPSLRPSDTVLDIGAGAGRHAVYLGGQVARVIAVEPSPSMQQHLARRAAEAPDANVTIVPERWPAAEVPACDVAICAH